MSLDTSAKKFVKNMANEQEKAEGTARYVEFVTFKKIEPKFNASFSDVSSKQIIDKKQVRTTFAFAIWYSTGSALTYMLNIAGVENLEEQLIEKTPFDIAANKVNLTSAQKDSYLAKAKAEFNWVDIEKEAKRLAEL